LDKLIKSGLLDLICNSKNISQAYERLLGVFIYRTLGYTKVIHPNTFSKNYFIQY